MAVDLSFFRSETSQRLRAEGRAEGHAAGQAEGRAQDVLLLLDERSVDVPDEARRRIAACHDLDLLGTWLRRAITATTADEVFGGD